ncbi:putative X protein [Hubei diptera virus 9]|uniref:Putative X protein n=1 Tax=Hubei diptera virus 9 TaxID=1922889 RepID=A0A1L3KMW8_9RHAB|nr:putative X protein [Hubei diptera virus 9]APG78732.1 putative X protein [Hubei diptera virus 9]
MERNTAGMFFILALVIPLIHGKVLTLTCNATNPDIEQYNEVYTEYIGVVNLTTPFRLTQSVTVTSQFNESHNIVYNQICDVGDWTFWQESLISPSEIKDVTKRIIAKVYLGLSSIQEATPHNKEPSKFPEANLSSETLPSPDEEEANLDQAISHPSLFQRSLLKLQGTQARGVLAEIDRDLRSMDWSDDDPNLPDNWNPSKSLYSRRVIRAIQTAKDRSAKKTLRKNGPLVPGDYADYLQTLKKRLYSLEVRFNSTLILFYTAVNNGIFEHSSHCKYLNSFKHVIRCLHVNYNRLAGSTGWELILTLFGELVDKEVKLTFETRLYDDFHTLIKKNSN